MPTEMDEYFSSFSTSRDMCFLCGAARDKLRDRQQKLIMGLHGGICPDCVRLSQTLLDQMDQLD